METSRTEARNLTDCARFLTTCHLDHNTVMCRVIYKTGFGLDGWIYLRRIHTTRDYRQLQPFCTLYSSPLHTHYVTRSSLVVSRQRISMPRPYFKSHMKSSLHTFLTLFCNCQLWRLDWIQVLCSQVRILAGWCPLSLVRITEELLEWKSGGSGLENRN
jgi:hypothetical protein